MLDSSTTSSSNIITTTTTTRHATNVRTTSTTTTSTRSDTVVLFGPTDTINQGLTVTVIAGISSGAFLIFVCIPVTICIICCVCACVASSNKKRRPPNKSHPAMGNMQHPVPVNAVTVNAHNDMPKAVPYHEPYPSTVAMQQFPPSTDGYYPLSMPIPPAHYGDGPPPPPPGFQYPM